MVRKHNKTLVYFRQIAMQLTLGKVFKGWYVFSIHNLPLYLNSYRLIDFLVTVIIGGNSHYFGFIDK
jgi:hypothetical protein